ncbi:MAG: polymer-forming cytoskeletal protein [Rhodospirillales bacterium]|jgi:cytoskeletal protein CcmA (bactofilin family)|nr:polymer-forming cytoskeletal protein [Rhodospirillales bacterium]MBT4040793.1 polymer-forming cytoskeletal protein [Rhodospirillales bacterium]MBT5352033.1 polymer-forming cytoskeletal protein [Rhodospirillales bacterium]MBT5521802.1 polymer-forming cytoskeletal protein [Rhodospirillales bacterium]MBT6109433.1 polymer-forming cytoskeletal protein [Rhodospirillales bacterium]
MDKKENTDTAGVNESAAPPLTPFATSGTPGTTGTSNASTPAAARSTFHPDVPARTGMLAASPTGGSAQSSASIDPNRLVIGREVKIKGGKITSCDRLTLEGEFEDVNLSKAQLLEVAPVGVFKGKAEVDEAVIGGRFEGDLTAHNRLTIKDGGSISGIVRYGSIVIEPGGSISGEMQTLTESGGS